MFKSHAEVTIGIEVIDDGLAGTTRFVIDLRERPLFEQMFVQTDFAPGGVGHGPHLRVVTAAAGEASRFRRWHVAGLGIEVARPPIKPGEVHRVGSCGAFLAIAALGAPAAAYFGLKLLPNTPMGKWLLLSAPARETVTKAAEQPGLHEFLNKTGVALSPLRPAGFARIDGQRVDVVTRGEMLDSKCPVQVVEVEGNRVVVSRREDGDSAQPASIEQPENERG